MPPSELGSGNEPDPPSEATITRKLLATEEAPGHGRSSWPRKKLLATEEAPGHGRSSWPPQGRAGALVGHSASHRLWPSLAAGLHALRATGALWRLGAVRSEPGSCTFSGS